VKGVFQRTAERPPKTNPNQGGQCLLEGRWGVEASQGGADGRLRVGAEIRRGTRGKTKLAIAKENDL